VVSWVVRSASGPTVVASFDRLAALQPGRGRPPAGAAVADAAGQAASRAEEIAGLKRVEGAARLSASVRHRTHRALAAKLLAAAPKGSRLDQMGAYLPECLRTLRIPRLDPAIVRGEAAYGLLETGEGAIYLPGFYQRCLVDTLERERRALRRARRGAAEDAIPLSELVERLLRRP